MYNLYDTKYKPTHPIIHRSITKKMSSALEDRWTPEQWQGLAREWLHRCCSSSSSSSSSGLLKSSPPGMASTDTPHDNLFRGRLGAFYLLYELGRNSNSNSNNNRKNSTQERRRRRRRSSSRSSIYQHQKPLQQARDGVLQVLQQLPTPWTAKQMKYHYRGTSISSTTLTLLVSDWMGAQCLLCAIEHALGNRIACQDVLKRIQQRLGTHLTAPSSPSYHNHHRNDPSVVTGTAGLLQAIVWLRQELDAPTLWEVWVVRLAVQLLKQAQVDRNRGVLFWPQSAITSPSNKQQQQQQCIPSSMESATVVQLGAARGVLGILYTLWACHPSDWQGIDAKLQWLQEEEGERYFGSGDDDHHDNEMTMTTTILLLPPKVGRSHLKTTLDHLIALVQQGLQQDHPSTKGVEQRQQQQQQQQRQQEEEESGRSQSAWRNRTRSKSV
jgi:hypothetical protein